MCLMDHNPIDAPIFLFHVMHIEMFFVLITSENYHSVHNYTSHDVMFTHCLVK
jgi:hypothetical protein